MTIIVTKEMLREKNPCKLTEFVNLFGKSVKLTVENLKLAYEADLGVRWFLKNFLN